MPTYPKRFRPGTRVCLTRFARDLFPKQKPTSGVVVSMLGGDNEDLCRVRMDGRKRSELWYTGFLNRKR